MKQTVLRYISSTVLLLLLAGMLFAGCTAADEPKYSTTMDTLPQLTNTVSAPYVDGQVIIQFDSTEEGIALLNSATILSNYTGLVPGMMLIKTPDGMTVEEAVSYYKNQPGVIFAEPNYTMKIASEIETPTTATQTSTTTKSPIPVFGTLAGFGVASLLFIKRRN